MGASSSLLLQGLRGMRHRRRAANKASTGNTPDVIGAHERYGRSSLSGGLEQLEPVPLHLSLPLPAVLAPPQHQDPAQRTLTLSPDRTLPTQHQHPGPGNAPRREAPAPQRAPRRQSPRTCTCPGPRCSCSCRCGCGATRSRSRPRPRRHRHRASRAGFGYDIQDVQGFLGNASLESPANIPMVLSRASVLYRTREGGWQEEVPLPLGMVVNGVFLVARWLYAQTPHGHEGYVSYSACIPLGILPRPGSGCAGGPCLPCWDTASDVFPAPSGNRTDTDKLSAASERSFEVTCGRRVADADAEQYLDTLFLRTAGSRSRLYSLRSKVDVT